MRLPLIFIERTVVKKYFSNFTVSLLSLFRMSPIKYIASSAMVASEFIKCSYHSVNKELVCNAFIFSVLIVNGMLCITVQL